MATDPGPILVTGASGFVGKHLMPALATAFPTASLVTPAIDIRDASQVEENVRVVLPKVCIHLAGVSAVAAAQRAPDHAWRVNFHGTMHLAWALSQYAPSCQMLFASTADAYGASFRLGYPLDETARLAPMNVYGHTKAAADLALGGMAGQGLRVVRLRPFNHIGPGQSADFVVASFARQIARIAAGLQAPVLDVGNLEACRDFLDVRDVCAAYVACVAKRDMLAPGAILNLASGHARRVGDLLSELAVLAGVELTVRVDKSRVRDTDIPVACGDATRARELLAWTPSIAWTRTLQDVIDDWRARISADPG